MTTNEEHLKDACETLLNGQVTAELMDNVEACITLVRHERLTSGNCQHLSTSSLSEGPPLFTPVVGERFCLDCHTMSDEVKS